MILFIAVKFDLWYVVFLNNMASTTRKSFLPWSSKLSMYQLFIWQSTSTTFYTNYTSLISFSMAISMMRSMWSSLLATWLRPNPPRCVVFTKPSMVSNRALELGSLNSTLSFCNVVSWHTKYNLLSFARPLQTSALFLQSMWTIWLSRGVIWSAFRISQRFFRNIWIFGDLVTPKYFLGQEFACCLEEIVLNQYKYVLDFL